MKIGGCLPYFSSLANSLISRFRRPVHEAAEWQAAMDHSLESRTLNPSISANAIAYDFCAPRVGRCVKRKLRPKSGDPSLLSPTSAIPHPCSEGGSMTIAKGGVSIFTFPRSAELNLCELRGKNRMHTLCPLIGEIKKARRGGRRAKLSTANPQQIHSLKKRESAWFNNNLLRTNSQV
jgi:hypothetical protein